MIFFCKSNGFVDNTFNDYQWAAPLIQDPNELEEYFRAKHIVGRIIKGFRAIGFAYNLDYEHIEDEVYRKLEGTLPEEELRYVSDFENIDPEFPINRFAEIDEPLIIVFKDGDRLEVNFTCDSEVHIGLNSIPFDIKAGINQNNFDANVIFSCCIGRKIQSIEIVRRDAPHDSWPGMYGEEWKKQKDFIDKVILRLDVGNGLCFTAWYDFGEVYVADANNEVVTAPFKELKPGLYDNFRPNDI